MRRCVRLATYTLLAAASLTPRLLAQETVIPQSPSPASFRQVFPKGVIYDFDLQVYNLTTPYASARLGEMLRTMDLPISGRRLGSPVYIVDGPKYETSVEAGPKGQVLIGRHFLEKMVGVKIRSHDPKSVNDAVRALMNNAVNRRGMESIIAHELGHQNQGHGLFSPENEFSRAARDKANFIRNDLGRIGFENDLRRTANRYEYEAYRQRWNARTSTKYQAQYDADVRMLHENLQRTGSLEKALNFMHRKRPPAIKAPRDGIPSRTFRLEALYDYISCNPTRFGPYVKRPFSIKVLGESSIKFTPKDQSLQTAYDNAEVLRRSLPAKAPNLTSHVHEYMADEHALISRYLKTGELRRSISLFNKLGPEPGKGLGLSDSHPSRGARVLNLVSYVEAHPEIFGKSLRKAVHIRVCRDLPAMQLKAEGGKIKVTGREAIVKRLSPPEQMLYKRYQTARGSYDRRVGGFINRRLLPKKHRYRSTEPYVVEAAKQAKIGEPSKVLGKTTTEAPKTTTSAGKAATLAGEAKTSPKTARTARQTTPRLLARPMGPRNSPEGRRREMQRLTEELLAQQQGKTPRRSLLKKATSGMGKTASTLFTIMLMNAASQHYYNGQVDLGAAVKGTLDSPEVWGGIAAAGVVDRGLHMATPRSLTAFQQRLLTSPGARGVFMRQLTQAKGCAVAMVSFQVVGAYIQAAAEGVDEDGNLTVSDMFAGKGEKGKAFLHNLGQIVADPAAHGAILRAVLKDKILTAEFGLALVGLIAGGKVGGLLGAKVGGVIGAVGGPAGIAIGAGVGGVVGGIVGGVVGGIGGSVVGAQIDAKIAEIRYKKAIEGAEALVARGPKEAGGLEKLWQGITRGEKDTRQIYEEDLKAAFDNIATLRLKLVESHTREVTRLLGKLPKTEDEGRRQKLQGELATLKSRIKERYLDELGLHDRLLKRKELPLGRKYYVDRENETVTELVLFSSQLDSMEMATAAQSAALRNGPTKAEGAPAYGDLVERSE